MIIARSFLGTFIFMLCFTNKVESRHIVGGDVVYDCLGVDTIANTATFKITFTMYRDAAGNGAEYDTNADFGIFRYNGVNWSYVRTITGQAASGIERVDNVVANPCLIIPPNIYVEKGIYQFNVELPIIDQSYLISYQRCCRNVTINNIIRPDDTGAAFTLEITAESQRTCNNSPKFKNFPPIVICLGEPVNFDHGAVDAEGDQLVYEFCAPLQAGGQDGVNGGDARSCTGVRPDPSRCPPPYRQVTYQLPTYSAINPLGGNPRVSIDSETGFISGIPTVQGQFVVGVCVKEFRDGALIGTLRRDFQFNVAQCEPTVIAEVVSEAVIDGKEFLINSCGENTVTFQNSSYNIANIISYDWRFISGSNMLTSTQRNATITFPGLGQYDGTMIINKGLDCADTANISVNIFPAITADFDFSYDTCIAGPVAFRDNSFSEAGPITNWIWDFGDLQSSDFDNPDHQYSSPGDYQTRMIVADENHCQDTMDQLISWQPAPSLIIIEPTTFIGCQPAQITFNNLSKPIDSTYIIEWDFGDGNKSDLISPTHVYESEGIYDVNVDITSPIGCTVSRRFPDWIEVKNSPEANFTYNPEKPNIINNSIDFVDDSDGAISWFWRFDELGISLDKNVTFTFPDTGVYQVDLIVLNDVACPDTIRQYIDVAPLGTFFLPNAFTANNDARNDEFLGVGFTDALENFNLQIYNRWGEIVFETNDPNVGWNGRKNNTGENSPPGVYVYVLRYFSPRGEKKVEKGHLTLIR